MSSNLPRMAAREVEAHKAQVRYRPFNCVWELTLACNLNCGHCGSSAGTRREGELDTLQALSVVDQLAELDCELITLSGGEPTLREDWDVIARAIHGHGVKVNMVTNGVRMDKAMAQRAIDAGLCNVAVSIDGPQAIHDSLRGARAFERSTAGIRHLVDAGMSVAVMTTIHRSNLVHLPEVREVAMGLGASMWRLQLGKPMGNLEDADTIAPADILKVLPMLAELKRQGGIHLAVGDSLGYYGPHDRSLRGWGWRGREERWAGCQAGMMAVGVESDGGVKGCLSIQGWKDQALPNAQGDFAVVDHALEGNLHERALADIWFDEASFAYNRKFSPESLTGGCARCNRASQCRGGARCVSTAFTGELGEDPYCWWRQSGQFEKGASKALQRGAAAAMLVAALGGAGCWPDDEPQGGGTGTDTSAAAEVEVTAPDVPVTPDGGDAIQPEAYPEYGVPPDTIEPDVQTDYGVPPDTSDVQPDTSDVPPETSDVQPDSAIDCEQVCCECEYGVIPEEVYQECCAPQPDVVEPDVQPEYGVPPDAQGETKPDVIDCDSVCCECDYGILPEGVYEECCDPCKDACCDCDYGDPPPPECCE